MSPPTAALRSLKPALRGASTLLQPPQTQSQAQAVQQRARSTVAVAAPAAAPTPTSTHAARVKHNPQHASPNIPWPVIVDRQLSLRAPPVVPSPKSTPGVRDEPQNQQQQQQQQQQQSDRRDDGEGQERSSSSSSAASIVSLFPVTLSAVCAAILTRDINERLQSRTKSLPTTSGISFHAAADAGPASESAPIVVNIRAKSDDIHLEPVPPSISVRKMESTMGVTLAALKVIKELIGFNDKPLHYENDEQLASMLNSAYPPLVEALHGALGDNDDTVSFSIYDGSSFGVHSAESLLASGNSQGFDEDEAIGRIIPKDLWPNVIESLKSAVNDSAILLTAKWLAAANFVSAILPSSVREELDFLGHYLMYCIESETAIDLPYLFPADFETDHTGAVIKINRPMSVFILRALARAAAGVAVALLPYIRKSQKGDRDSGDKENIQAGDGLTTAKDLVQSPPQKMRRSSLQDIHSPDRLRSTDPTGSSAVIKSRERVRGFSLGSSPPPTSFLRSPTILVSQAVTSDDLSVWPSPAVPGPVTASLTDVGESQITQRSDAIVKTTAIDIPAIRYADHLPLRRSGNHPSAGLSSSPAGSWRSAELRVPSSSSSRASSPDLLSSSATPDWEAFRIQQAGIPVEILRLEFEAIRAGKSQAFVNDEEAW